MKKTTVAERDWDAGLFTLDDAVRALEADGWTAQRNSKESAHVALTRGSRLRLRMLGVVFASTRANLPVKIELSTRGDGAIHAAASGNPGWYLFYFNLDDLYLHNCEGGLAALDRLAHERTIAKDSGQ